MYRSCKRLGLVLQELPPRFDSVRSNEVMQCRAGVRTAPLIDRFDRIDRCMHANVSRLNCSVHRISHPPTTSQMVDARQPLKRLVPWQEAAAKAREEEEKEAAQDEQQQQQGA